MISKRGDREFDANSSEATMDELREFLEGDVLDVGADPKFKEELRRKLWDLVQSKMSRGHPNGSNH
jgi:hypothetical protein